MPAVKSRIARGAVVDPTAHVYNARVEEGAHVGPYAMLLPGARVEEGAHVGPYAIIDCDAIVTAGTHVPAHAHVPPATVANPANVASFYVSDAVLEHRYGREA